MGDYGIKISKAGYDVITATDDQLAFSSLFNMFKASAIGSFTTTVGAGGLTTTNIAHGLSYAPSFEVFISGDANETFYCPFDNGTIQFFIIPNKIMSSNVYSNGTNLVIEVGNSDTVQRTFYVKYFIYKDEVA